MPDDEQTPPRNWTEHGGMVPQQESANDWAKEIAQAAKERADANAQAKGMEQGRSMGR